MATPTTLTERVTQQLASWQSEKTTAQAAVQTAQSALVAAQESFKATTKEYADRDKDIAAIRLSLATITTPADAAPLVAELQAAIIAQRATTAALITDETSIAQARADADAARERVRVADAGIVSSQAELDAIQLEQGKRDAAKTAIAQAPITTLAAAATSLLASQTFIDAKARIDTDFPQALQDRARERATFAANRLGRANQAVIDSNALIAAQYTASGNASEKLYALERTLADREAELFDFATRAANRFDVAEATLERIADPTYAALTAEEHAAIDDATLATDRENAAAAESDRDTAREAHEVAQAAYDLEELKVLAADGAAGVTAALADATSDLAQAKSDLDAAAADLQQAETDYDAAERTLVDEWEATVPDSAWRDLADFEAAKAVLAVLQANPTVYATNVTNAENALLTALLVVDDEALSLSVLTSAATANVSAAAAASAVAERTRLSALRGDF